MHNKTYTYECYGDVYEVYLRFGKYAGGRLALTLMDSESGLVAKATVNIPEAKLATGEILVKTWSENKVMADFLMTNGIATDTGKRVQAGFAESWVMRLAPELEAALADAVRFSR